MAVPMVEPRDYLPDDAVHVFPLFGREHVLDGLGCWCHPEPLPEQPSVIVHNVEQ
jgi:hypothetical protein